MSCTFLSITFRYDSDISRICHLNIINDVICVCTDDNNNRARFSESKENRAMFINSDGAKTVGQLFSIEAHLRPLRKIGRF